MVKSLTDTIPDFVELLRACAAKGMTGTEAAKKLGVSQESIRKYTALHAIPFDKRKRFRRAGKGTLHLGHGRTKGVMPRIMVPLPTSVFADLRKTALAEKTSLAEQVRTFVKAGLYA